MARLLLRALIQTSLRIPYAGLFQLRFHGMICLRHRRNTALCSLIYLAARSSECAHERLGLMKGQVVTAVELVISARGTTLTKISEPA